MDALMHKKSFIIRVVYAAIILGIAIFLCRVGLKYLWPFLVAWIVALIISPVVKKLNQRVKLPNVAGAVILTVIFYAVIGTAVILLGIKAFALIRDTVIIIPSYYQNTVEPVLYQIGDWMTDSLSQFDAESARTIETYLSQFAVKAATYVSDASISALKTITGYAFSLPMILVNTIIMIAGTVFLATDLTRIKEWLLMQCTEQQHYLLHNARIHLGRTLKRYIKTYGIILFVTFCELTVALLILRRDNAPLLAGAIAILDILPVVGCGTVLIPWGIICLFTNRIRLGIGILISYLIITIIRNVIEPKLIGQHVGMHPIVTLLAMVVGSAVFGGIGILGLPIFLALLISLNNDGVIHIFRGVEAEKKPEEDNEKIKTLQQENSDPVEAKSDDENTLTSKK